MKHFLMRQVTHCKEREWRKEEKEETEEEEERRGGRQEEHAEQESDRKVTFRTPVETEKETDFRVGIFLFVKRKLTFQRDPLGN